MAVTYRRRRTSLLECYARDSHSVRSRHEGSNEDLSDDLDDACHLQCSSESAVLRPVLHEDLMGTWHIAVPREIDGENLIRGKSSGHGGIGTDAGAAI